MAGRVFALRKTVQKTITTGSAKPQEPKKQGFLSLWQNQKPATSKCSDIMAELKTKTQKRKTCFLTLMQNQEIKTGIMAEPTK